METRKVRIKTVNSRDIRIDDDENVLTIRPMRRMTHVSVVECPCSGQTAIVDRCVRCERFIRIMDNGENVSVECKA